MSHCLTIAKSENSKYNIKLCQTAQFYIMQQIYFNRKMMNKGKLLLNALIKFIAGIILFSMLLFIPVGTCNYPEAWQLLSLLFIPMFIIGSFLFIYSPELLAKRIDSKEKIKRQKGIIKFSGFIFITTFIIAGLDKRFGWSDISYTIRFIFSLLFLFSYALYAEVMRENIWLSRTIKVSEGQKTVTTGLYRIVRHPMYLASLLMFTSMPIILGSWYAFAVILLYIPIIVARIIDEERFLKNNLEGYQEYCQKLRWRLVPFIW